ncbi:glycoside hydrolase family 43 protein [Pisolithus marmoratus]|nr:glycoside hydrolase family 43 protein [Pisolithus marmoratus]
MPFRQHFLSLTVLYGICFNCVYAAVYGPVISANFPDPAILVTLNVTYAYATNSGNINIQVATSYDNGTTWTLLDGVDALPDVGPWATVNLTWAPDVIDRGDGTFVMYYAAESPSQMTHRVGAATSTNPVGPYTPQTQPIACQTAGGGAIDPAGFQDVDGQRYIVYKVDGNNLGGEMMEADALTPTGDPVQILDRGPQDGPLIEAPVLILHNGTYVLTFSSNCYNTDLYDISYATAPSVFGPYMKASSPFLVTGDDGLTGPGEVTPTPDGTFMVFHATVNFNPLTGCMYTATISWNGTAMNV